MSNKLYDIAGATGLIAVAAVWVLLSYLRIGGTPVFILSAIGLICSQVFVMHQAVLQRRYNEFGSFKALLLGCSWWFAAILSLPIAMVSHFGVLVSVR